MAGGTWRNQNKVRPGAYINFKGVSKPSTSLGIRGVMTMPVPMGWGATITELFSTDLMDGKSLPKIGYTALDEECQIFREALKHAYKAIIYRLDTGGLKATATIENLTMAAKYAGVVGNEISMTIIENGVKFDVVTLFRGTEKDRQTVVDIKELKGNDWVDFSGTGELVANAGITLQGGTNGTITNATYTEYLNAIKTYSWNTMAIPQDTPTLTTLVISFIKSQRDDFGRKVQAVLYNAEADYEGIIVVKQGYKMIDETISPTVFTAYVAGLTAGAEVNQSNTYHVIPGAISIIYPAGVVPYGDTEIIEALQRGEFTLSTRRDGAVVVEQDINSLHTFTAEQGYTFSKNRVIRTLDEINNSVALMFEKNFIGKVNNDANGRSIFKASIISYLNNLQAISAIQNFDATTDIQISAGEAIDSVVVDLAIQPVDSMEKLYMTVMVG